MRLFFAVLLNSVSPPLGFLILKDIKRFYYFLIFSISFSFLLQFLVGYFYRYTSILFILYLWITILFVFYGILLWQTLISRRRNISKTKWTQVVLSLILLAFGYLIIDNYKPFIKGYTIPSLSMEPSIRKGDWILVDHQIDISQLKRGSLIVTEESRDGLKTKSRYIKRLIGLPGDKIEIQNKVLEIGKRKANVAHVAINGKFIEQKILPFPSHKNHDMKLDEIYSLEESMDGYKYQIFESEREFIIIDSLALTVQLKENEYFVLGDNRDDSFDSRYTGNILGNQIKGVYAFTYFSINHNENQCMNMVASEESCADDLFTILKRKQIRWDRIGIRVN
jgi:signal peptidase I